MGKLNKKEAVNNNIFINLLWLNIKRFKTDFIWRLLLTAINFMLFYSLFNFDKKIVIYILVIVSISNIVNIYSHLKGKNNSFTLMLSMGASKLFIIFDNMIEIMIELILALIIAVPFLFFKNSSFNLFLVFLIQLAIVIIENLIISVFTSSIKKNKEDE